MLAYSYCSGLSRWACCEQPQLLPAVWGPAALKVLQLCPDRAIYSAESAASCAFPHQGNQILQWHSSCSYLIFSVWLVVTHLLVMQNLLSLTVYHKFNVRNYCWVCKTNFYSRLDFVFVSLPPFIWRRVLFYQIFSRYFLSKKDFLKGSLAVCRKKTRCFITFSFFTLILLCNK